MHSCRWHKICCECTLLNDILQHDNYTRESKQKIGVYTHNIAIRTVTWARSLKQHNQQIKIITSLSIISKYRAVDLSVHTHSRSLAYAARQIANDNNKNELIQVKYRT